MMSCAVDIVVGGVVSLDGDESLVMVVERCCYTGLTTARCCELMVLSIVNIVATATQNTEAERSRAFFICLAVRSIILSAYRCRKWSGVTSSIIPRSKIRRRSITGLMYVYL